MKQALLFANRNPYGTSDGGGMRTVACRSTDGEERATPNGREARGIEDENLKVKLPQVLASASTSAVVVESAVTSLLIGSPPAADSTTCPIDSTTLEDHWQKVIQQSQPNGTGFPEPAVC